MKKEKRESWTSEVAGFLEKKGYVTELNKIFGQYKFDIWAEHPDDEVEDMAVECRHSERPVVHTVIRNVKTKTDQAHGGFGAKPAIAYTSSLTDKAAENAQEWDFELISVDDVRG